METLFVRRTPCLDRVYFALALDRKRMKERILIGRNEEIRAYLMGSKDADVMVDVT